MVMMQMGLKFIKEKNEQKERKTCIFDYLKFLHITQSFFKARVPQLDIDRLFSLSLLNVEDSWFKSLVPNSTSLLKSIPLILFLLCSSILKVKKILFRFLDLSYIKEETGTLILYETCYKQNI